MDEQLKENRAVTSPHYNIKVFNYWGDFYEAVFILFKPFYQFKNGSKYNREKLFEDPNVRENWFDIIQMECVPVKWNKVKEEVGFSDFWEVDDGMKGAFENPENSRKLWKYVESEEMIHPTEDYFSNFQVDDILNSFKYLGYTEFYTGPQFHNVGFEETKLYSIGTDPLNLLGSQNIFAPDNKILFTTAFDLHYGFICSDRITIEKLIDKFHFEGFFCDENTTTWWSRESAEVGEE